MDRLRLPIKIDKNVRNGGGLMEGLAISFVTETSSFRDPGGQLYHSCLPLPSYTTLVGLAGAALGMSFQDSLFYFKKHNIHVGVKGVSLGGGKDLWNYSKIASEKNPGKDILKREFLYRLQGCLYYACSKEQIIKDLAEAFSSPVYALTLGNSDDLVKIIDIRYFDDVKEIESTDLKNTVIAEDISTNYALDWEKIKQSPIRLTLKVPTIKSLPVDFEFDKKGSRTGKRYEVFSFVGDLEKLKKPALVYCFGEDNIPMFSAGG